MKWPWTTRSRYEALKHGADIVRAHLERELAEAKAETQLARRREETAEQELAAEKAESRRLRDRIEAITDNALFAAGSPPVFDPKAERFQLRPIADQRVQPMNSVESPAVMRRRWERMSAEQAADEERRAIAAEIRRLAPPEENEANG